MCDSRKENTVSTKKYTDRLHEKIECFQIPTVSTSSNSSWVINLHNLCCWIEDLVFRSWPLPGIGTLCMTASLSTTKCCLRGDGGRLCWSHFMAFPKACRERYGVSWLVVLAVVLTDFIDFFAG